MRNYELTVILPADAQAKQKETLTDLEKKVESASGKVEKITEWGRRQLAYKIKKQDTGVYHFMQLSLPVEVVGDLNRYLQVNADVVRHLLVLREGKEEEGQTEKQKVKRRAKGGEK